MMSRLFVFLALVAYVLADDDLDLTDSDFDNKIGDHDTALIMFYAPWCGHCKRIKPEFAKAATTLKANDPPVMLGKVDCTEGGKDICSRMGVSGYPTLKIFRGGEVSSDYNGPREAPGIVKYMKGQVGAASTELKSVEQADAVLAKPEVVIAYFGDDSSALYEAFMKVANKNRETWTFAHSLNSAVNEKNGYSDKIVLFRPKHLHNKFEPASVVYDGLTVDKAVEAFVKVNYHGLVGHRTQDTMADFPDPVVVAFYNVDYVKNVKGTNYWRNRVLKVAQNYADDFKFAVANKDDFQQELNEYGLEFVAGDKPVVCAKDSKSRKFIMSAEFSMETFEAFLKSLIAGELEPHVKSEPVPEQDGGVLVAVGKNFDELVTDSGRDALIEFYAPWCGHCKKLTPVYDELGEKMRDEDVDIIKMDATANDVPSTFNVRGFPTIFWRPANGAPESYNGGREVDDFVKFIAKSATNELKSFDRSGKAKKTEL